MKNSVRAGLTSTLLGGLTFAALGYTCIPKVVEKQELPSMSAPINIRKDKFMTGPVYSSEEVPSSMCARYLRLSANDLFGLQYPKADAWNIRDDSRVSEIPVSSVKDLENLAERGVLKPGMGLGLYNPTSRYNSVAQKDGAGYTHVAIYLGKEDGKLCFADKFGKETRPKIALGELLNRGNLQPREVLYLNN